MGVLNHLLGSGRGDAEDDSRYYELDSGDLTGTRPTDAETVVYTGKVTGKEDLETVKDRLYDGGMAIVDIRYVESASIRLSYILSELQSLVEEETGGDIVRRGDEYVIGTPAGTEVSRSPEAFG